MLSQGFAEVFHLQGGILGYLEQVPAIESRFAGECFVFDERVAVTQGLAPGEAVLCRACRNPMRPEEAVGGVCPSCAGATHAGVLERERQMALAASRGEAHLGEDAKLVAARNRAEKVRRRTGG